MSQAADSPVTTGRRIGVVLGLVTYLAVGFLYLTSGLVVPGIGLVILWIVYLVGVWMVARLVAKWSLWTLAAGPLALGFWWVYLLAGEALFGWSA